MDKDFPLVVPNSEDEQTVLRIENLDCPVCAEALQSDLQKIKGVKQVRVDYVTQTITLYVTDNGVLQKVIQKTNKFEQVRVLDGGMYELKQKNPHLKAWVQIAVSALFLTLGLLLEFISKAFLVRIAAYVAYAVAYLSVGMPVLISTAKNLAKGRIFDENFLMTIASLGAVALGEYSEAVLVLLLYQLGELLQSIAVGSSRRSVEKLMELKSEHATLLKNGEQITVKPEELSVGDILLVKAGERAPVDGVLLSESALLDVKSLTGESELQGVRQGGEILSGSINVGGVYEMKVLRPYKDSAVARILEMVEKAAVGKAAPEKFIAKFAKIYTPAVCVLALLMAVCMPLLSGLIVQGAFVFMNAEHWIRSALIFLVVSCPCALVISVPLTYFSGIGTCAKNGILVKGATYLDVAAKAKIIAFDKTGTLTEGNFTVCTVYAENIDERELLALAAAIEQKSSHPIAKAFAEVATEYTAQGVTELAGHGLQGNIDGAEILVGNELLLVEHGVAFQKRESAYTLVYVAKNGRYLGVIEVGDRLRKESKNAVAELKKLGLSRSAMLTGDRLERAQKIATEAGVYEVKAELLPDDKLRMVEKLKTEGEVIYVGDGINDAPVMMAANCAVSMGALGSAAAVEASDFVLIADDLSALPKAIRIARKTRTIVVQNIVFSIAMKLGFMALGAFGVLPVGLAVFADVGVMLLAVCNSFRVRAVQKFNKK